MLLHYTGTPTAKVVLGGSAFSLPAHSLNYQLFSTGTQHLTFCTLNGGFPAFHDLIVIQRAAVGIATNWFGG